MRHIAHTVWNFVIQNSLLLVLGATAALLFANTNPAAYHVFQEFVIADNFFIGHAHENESGAVVRTLTLHYLVNDLLMALFFAIAGKEVWEAIALRDGSLRGKTAITPLVATLGGMMGPIIIYLGIAMLFGSTTLSAIYNGWAIPTATDIAFSYFVGRIIFGAKHPAVSFLLLLAIADDAGGLLILAIAYPQGALAPAWLLLSFGVSLAAYLSFNLLPRMRDKKRGDGPAMQRMVRKVFGPYPYIIAGVISWYAFQESGLHPALGLLPIIPAIPHADHDEGIFEESEEHQTDLLNTFEHVLKIPVQFILMIFAFLNAGIQFTAMSEATWAVLGGLLIGKPLGIFLFGMFAASVLRLGLPEGMQKRDLFTLGCVAAIGFTVSLFVASVAFDPSPIQDAAKMGALLSLLALVPAFAFGKMLRVQKVTEAKEPSAVLPSLAA